MDDEVYDILDIQTPPVVAISTTPVVEVLSVNPVSLEVVMTNPVALEVYDG